VEVTEVSVEVGGSDLPIDLVVHSATAIDGVGTRPGSWIAAAEGTIRAVGGGDAWRALPGVERATVHDAAGAVVTPGFVDVHCHGGHGLMFDDGADAIRAALRCHRAHGTTRSVVSLVSNPIDRMCAALRAVGEVMRDDTTVLGAHAEGPFLSPARRGAHALAHLRDPDPTRVDALLDAAGGNLRQLTIAPELPGAFDAIDRLVDDGVVVAIGHTDADGDTARRAFDAGARLVTHAFNGMTPMHHRAPGPAIAAINDPRIGIELITDGHHVHPDLIRTTFAAAPARVLLITDAMAAACCGDGAYRLGDVDVTVADGRATVNGSDALAGSTVTQDVALRVAIQRCGVEPTRAVEAVTATPARAMGVDDRIGLLQPGFVADLVLLDDDWRVHAVWCDGTPVEPCAP
jgi:N-acetylglucosamine-6-phosphate deacetylase